MGMFVLGLVIGCAGCAVVALVLFGVLGFSIVGKRGRKAEETQPKEP